MSDIEKVLKTYYVYHCYVDGVLRYVGMGKGNRYKHCSSGISSCLELNKDFHEGKEIVVTKIKEKLTKSQAQQIEAFEIDKHETLYNKRRGIDFSQVPDVSKSKDYKILASMGDIKDKDKILKVLAKKSPDIDEKLYWQIRNVLNMAGSDLFLVQYDKSAPILIVDKAVINQYEVSHLGCFNYPFCAEFGCGGLTGLTQAAMIQTKEAMQGILKFKPIKKQ